MGRRGRVFVISAPSGGGKTTVSAALLRRVPRLVRSVSVTTRPPRVGERDGRDYVFASRQAFLMMRRVGGFLEWARVFGAYYGTPRAAVQEMLGSGRDVLLLIDVQGARQVQVRHPDCVTIFLMPPSLEALEVRLRGRSTESAAERARRLRAARAEIAAASWYDYVVVNRRVRSAVAALVAIVRTARRDRGMGWRQAARSGPCG